MPVKPSESDWEERKGMITSLYIEQNWTLDEIKEEMAYKGLFATQYSQNPPVTNLLTMRSSKAQFERRLKGKWGLRKYRKREDWQLVSLVIERRKAIGKESQLIIDGKEVSEEKVKKEMARYCSTGKRRLQINGENIHPHPSRIQ